MFNLYENLDTDYDNFYLYEEVDPEKIKNIEDLIQRSNDVINDLKNSQERKEKLFKQAEEIYDEVENLNKPKNNTPKMSKGKKLALGGAITAGTAGLAYGGYKLYKHLKNKKKQKELNGNNLSKNEEYILENLENSEMIYKDIYFYEELLNEEIDLYDF